MPSRLSKLLPGLGGFALIAFTATMGLGAVLDPGATRSTMDGRNLAALDAPSQGSVSSGAWMSGAEAWADDHVPARSRWLTAHAELSTRVFRSPVVNGVYVGDPRGMLLDELPDYTVPAKLGSNAQQLGDAVRAAGSQILFVYVPRKEEVFSDRYPKGWPNHLASTRAQVIDAFARGGPVLDLTPALSDRAKRDGYFYRTDHHWTPQGAEVALAEITARAKQLGVTIPEDTRPYHSVRYRPFYGSQARKVTAGAVVRPDAFVVPRPPTWNARSCSQGVCDAPTFLRSRAKASDLYTNRYGAFLGGDNGYQPLYNATLPKGQTILFLKDSLGNSVSTYLAERVRKVVTIDERTYKGDDIASVVAREHPSLVVVMHNQATVLGNPQFDSGVWTNVAEAVANRRRGDG